MTTDSFVCERQLFYRGVAINAVQRLACVFGTGKRGLRENYRHVVRWRIRLPRDLALSFMSRGSLPLETLVRVARVGGRSRCGQARVRIVTAIRQSRRARGRRLRLYITTQPALAAWRLAVDLSVKVAPEPGAVVGRFRYLGDARASRVMV